MPNIDNILNQDLPMRVRSNHALEHATLHVLQEKGIKTQLGGISDVGGFWIFIQIVPIEFGPENCLVSAVPDAGLFA